MTAKSAAADPPTPAPAHGELLRELFLRQEHERRQVARALHNEIGQAVSAIKMSAHLAMDEADAGQRGEDLREIVRIADDTVARLRDLYASLRPPQIDALGLEASLRGEAERFAEQCGCTPRLELAAPAQRPDMAVELAAFRLAQDLLQPLPALARLLIRLSADDGLQLDIEHDGPPPAPLLLALMQARAEAAAGSLSLRHDAGGVRLRARFPLAP